MPLIVQEIPAQYVQILSRVNNVLTVRKPAMECFGENITNITNDIFDVSSSESAYKIILEKLSREMNFEDILTLFNGNLSFHAMIFLKSCYNKDKE